MDAPASSSGSKERAIQKIKSAQTIEELRQAQAVLLTLAFGLTFRQAAEAIGVSAGWVSRLRTQFLNGQFVGDPARPRAGGRRHANMSESQEQEFLANLAAKGVLPTVRDVKVALEARLGRLVARSAVYDLLGRHGYQARRDRTGRFFARTVSLEETLEGLADDLRRGVG